MWYPGSHWKFRTQDQGLALQDPLLQSPYWKEADSLVILGTVAVKLKRTCDNSEGEKPRKCCASFQLQCGLKNKSFSVVFRGLFALRRTI